MVTTWKVSMPLRKGLCSSFEIWMMREDLLAVEVLRPESCGRDDIFSPWRQILARAEGEERYAL